MKNKKTVKLIIEIAVVVIFIAFLAVIALRKYIFPGDSLLYNLYDEEYATNVGVRLIKTVVILISCILIMKVSNYAVMISEKVSNNTVKTVVLLVGNVVKYASAIAIVILSLSAWGVDTTAIVTGAGVITLIIGLGCQTMVSDIVSGIFMLFEGDIKVGDIVVINGWRGTVQQIGLRRTRIEDAVGNINIINNSSISNIINNTQRLSIALIDVGTEYNESILRIEEVLNEALPEMKRNIPAIVEGPYYKGISALGESCVNIRLVAKCKEEDKYQVERDMNREIKILFDKHQINIPFNQIVVNYRDPNEPDKTQWEPKSMKRNEKFRAEQKELSGSIEQQNE